MDKEIELCIHKTQYYETDQMGIIHHSNYIKWFEEARCHILDQMGFSYDKMEEAGIIIPVLNVSCEYKAMVHFGDTVIIIPKIEKFNGIKLEMSYKIYDAKTRELKTVGETKHCFLNKEDKIVNLKKGFKEIYDVFDNFLGVEFSF
ncbi:MAG: yneP [Bacillota bacterium]|nr:yneP [Bacillota bacterium]